MISTENPNKRWVQPRIFLKAPLHVRTDVVGLGNLATKLKNWLGAKRVKVFRQALQTKLGRGNANWVQSRRHTQRGLVSEVTARYI